MKKQGEEKETNGAVAGKVRMRKKKKVVKVKMIYRTWLRTGSGTRLLRTEEGWENRTIEVRVPVKSRRRKEPAE